MLAPRPPPIQPEGTGGAAAGRTRLNDAQEFPLTPSVGYARWSPNEHLPQVIRSGNQTTGHPVTP
jgi:hypothetical protein